LVRAGDWYLKAALQGSAEALEECWKCVRLLDEKGQREHAIKLCETAPLSDRLECQRYLIKVHFDRGDRQDILRWSLRAAERGEPSDVFYVGTIYSAEAQPLLALEFFRKAAAEGHGRAHQRLGEMLAYGLGVPKDEDTSVSHYQEAAKQGYLLSQMRLLHIRRKSEGFFGRLILLVRIVTLAIRFALMWFRNKDDPRLADIKLS
jgi:TPR repeat protein